MSTSFTGDLFLGRRRPGLGESSGLSLNFKVDKEGVGVGTWEVLMFSRHIFKYTGGHVHKDGRGRRREFSDFDQNRNLLRKGDNLCLQSTSSVCLRFVTRGGVWVPLP